MIGDDSPKQRPIPHLRWWIAALLFASTVINYIDRQTLSLLAPYLKQDYHWTNTDYANLVIAFRVAYSIGQTLCGRLMDRIGTRSEEHTSELQSRLHLVCRLLLEKKKKQAVTRIYQTVKAAHQNDGPPPRR